MSLADVNRYLGPPDESNDLPAIDGGGQALHYSKAVYDRSTGKPVQLMLIIRGGVVVRWLG